jgi:hypothetical protein
MNVARCLCWSLKYVQHVSKRDLLKLYILYQIGLVALRLHNASFHSMFSAVSAVTKSYSSEVIVHCNSCLTSRIMTLIST